jgi:hypothetical protein
MMRRGTSATAAGLVSAVLAISGGAAAAFEDRRTEHRHLADAPDPDLLLSQCGPGAEPLILASTKMARDRRPDPMEIGADPLRIPLAPTDALTGGLDGLGPRWEFYLALGEVRARIQPGVVFRVFIGREDAAIPAEPYFAFDLYLYDGVSPAPPQYYSVNVTEQMRRLQTLQPASMSPVVTIRPELSSVASERAAQIPVLQRARTTIGTIELIAQCR